MRTLQEVLDALAVPGADHDAVVDYLAGSLKVRRRHRTVMAATAAAAVMIVGGVALAATDRSPDDEIVADRKASEPRRSTTTSSPPDPAGVAAQTSTSVATTTSLPFVPTTTTIELPRVPSNAPAPFAVPPTTTTTTVADRPLTATLELVNTTPTVGEPATFRVVWSDPDLPADIQPSVVLQPGDPAVAGTNVAVESASCVGGQPRSGTVDAATRYTRAGTYTVSAVVSACGQSMVATTSVMVKPPATGRAVVVTTADPSMHPESANVAFSSDPGDPAGWLPFPPRDPSLRLFHDGYPATVVVLDPTSVGTMRLQFGSTSLCGPVDLTVVPADVTARVSVTTAC
jgi:hypothetical protein